MSRQLITWEKGVGTLLVSITSIHIIRINGDGFIFDCGAGSFVIKFVGHLLNGIMEKNSYELRVPKCRLQV
jgi:hypothetical protein